MLIEQYTLIVLHVFARTDLYVYIKLVLINIYIINFQFPVDQTFPNDTFLNEINKNRQTQVSLSQQIHLLPLWKKTKI